MKRLLKDFLSRRRTSAEARRRRALRRAVEEMRLRESQEGSIWKSGKGGAHYDH